MRITLKAARVNAGLRQADVAEKLGKSLDAIKYVETDKGASNLTYTELKQFCNLYGCSPDDIFLPTEFA